MIFAHRIGSWDLREGVRLVGILNVTPDSFYDGGRYAAPDRALARAEELAAEGADAIDVGAQSTRPGGVVVSADEEWARLEPVLPAVVRLGLPVSIDTYRAEVARRAVDAGAAMINDVSGLTVDAEIARIAARTGAGLVIMHSLGAPDRIHDPVEYGDVAVEVRDFLARQMAVAMTAGVRAEQIALDPGIGFSKRAPQSVEALRGIPLLAELGRPVYVGVSRKSFLAGPEKLPPEERLAASLEATALAVSLGARIVRTHDVRATREMLSAREGSGAVSAGPGDGPVSARESIGHRQ